MNGIGITEALQDGYINGWIEACQAMERIFKETGNKEAETIAHSMITKELNDMDQLRDRRYNASIKYRP